MIGFNEKDRAEYEAELRRHWEAGELDGEELVLLLTLLELADVDGSVSLDEEDG